MTNRILQLPLRGPASVVACVTVVALLIPFAPVTTALGVGGSQQAKLLAGDPGLGDDFGFSVALSGNTLIVGAPHNDDAGADSGSAYVYVRVGTVWVQQAKLVADDAAAEADFGTAVDIDGNYIVVGAHQGTPFTGPGAAYVFVRQAGVWSQQARITDANSLSTDGFGRSVSIGADTLAVGVPFTDVGFNQSGSVQVYTRSGTAWSLQAALMADDPVLGAILGNSVSVSGDILVAGAPGDDDSGDDSGSAYVFVRNGAAWSFADKLTANDGLAGDSIGFSVSADTDSVALGGPAPFQEPLLHPGMAYVFGLDETPWTNLGGGTLGIGGQPILDIFGPLTPGSTLDIGLTQAPPQALMLMRASLTSAPLAVVGGTLYPNPFDVQLLVPADAAGAFQLSALVAPGAASGVDLFFQFIVQDLSVPHQITLSNAMTATIP